MSPHASSQALPWKSAPAYRGHPTMSTPVPARSEYVTTRSREMHERARGSLAGGVASVARLFPPPWPYPPYLVEGHGSHVTDVDGNDSIDYNLAHGPLILGHRPPELTAAIVDILQ